MPAGLGRRSGVGLAGWVRVVGTRGSDAAGRRQLRFSSRSLRAWPDGSPDVLPLCLANAHPSAAQPGFRSNRLLSVCFLPLSAWNIRTKSSLRRTRNSPGSLALSPHLVDWKNLALSVGRCRRHYFVAHLGRRHALPATPRIYLRTRIMGFLLAVLCHSRLRNGQHHLHLLGLLQHLSSRRRNPRSCPQYSARHFYFHYRHRHFVSGHADQHPWSASMAAGARLALHRQRLRGKALRLGRGALRHRHGPMDCFRFGVLFPARILPRPVLRSAGWKFFSHLRSRASRKEISAYLASFSGRPYVSLCLALQAQDGNRRGPRHAPYHSVHRSGRRSNAVTTPLVSGASAV